jgi:TonB family protein
MKKHTNLILLLLFMAVAVHGQDTLFFDANNKKIAVMDSASSYRICIPDTNRRGNVIEITYLKSGKMKSFQPMILQFKRNTDTTIIKSYTSGKVAWNDTSMKNHIEKLKDGICKEWYENGQLRKEVEYKEGKTNGLYISYWENGQIKRKEYLGIDKSIEGKCYDQEGKEIKHTPMEQMPEFPGGTERLMSFISQNIRYPVAMMENKIQGTVIAQFIVKKDGSISDIKIIRSVYPKGDSEAIRVISLMPKWKPGIQEDEPVSVRYTLPIKFQMTEDNKSTDPFATQNSNSSNFQENNSK